MQYCTKCGKELQDNFTYCPFCNTKVANNEMMNDSQIRGERGNFSPTKQSIANQLKTSEPLDILCLLGFIFSFVVMLAGLILSILAYKRVKDEGKSINKTLAKIGIIIASLQIVIIIVILLIVSFAGVVNKPQSV